MSKSCDYEVMTSLPPEAEYPVEPFQWGLPAVQIWKLWKFENSEVLSFSMTRDIQTGNFAGFWVVQNF